MWRVNSLPEEKFRRLVAAFNERLTRLQTPLLVLLQWLLNRAEETTFRLYGLKFVNVRYGGGHSGVWQRLSGASNLLHTQVDAASVRFLYGHASE